jgi:glutathione S-transferase
MKLYTFAFAPNPRRVHVYLAEKGIELTLETVDIMTQQNRTPDFLKKNPLGGLPVLELDDGNHLTESLAIMEYLEELHPEKPMIGKTPLERARTREVERIAEIGVLAATGTIFQNTSPFFAGRVKQSAEAAETGRLRLAANLTVLDHKIGDKPFVMGAEPTIADCTLFAALKFGDFAGAPLDRGFRNVARWFDAFAKRPSAAD